MSNKPLDLTKPVQTRGGNAVTIFKTDAKHFKYPVMGSVLFDGVEFCYCWTADGKSDSSGNANANDLVNVAEKFRIERWVNIYGKIQNGDRETRARHYCSADEANCANESDGGLTPRAACIKVVIEGAEGDGL